MIFQVTQLLLILSVFKVNGISFRHDVSGYVMTDGIASSLFEPIPTQQPTDATTDFSLSHLNYGPLSNSIDPLEAYISGKDGRLLKQYEVFEDHGEGDIFNELRHPQKSLPEFFYPTAHISSELLYPDPAFPYPGFKELEYDSFSSNPIKSQLTNNHGPIALGSGALGYIRLPSGAVYLGSGSLAYISHKDHHESLSNIHERKNVPSVPGPLTFGHPHNE